VVVSGVAGRPADGIGQDTGSQVMLQMHMLCRVIGLKGVTIRGLDSPLPLAHAQSLGLRTSSTNCLP